MNWDGYLSKTELAGPNMAKAPLPPPPLHHPWEFDIGNFSTLIILVLTWCENIFVGSWRPPVFFFGRSLSFLILSIIIIKNKKIVYVGSFNYFAFTIHIGSNCYINTGVCDLEDFIKEIYM